MQVKKANVPVFHVHFSNLEATAALHAVRIATAALSKAGPTTPYEVAALAFAKSFETLLIEQGAKNQLDEIVEKYSLKKSVKPKEEAKKVAKTKEESKGPEEPSDEEDLKSLIAQDEELING